VIAEVTVPVISLFINRLVEDHSEKAKFAFDARLSLSVAVHDLNVQARCFVVARGLLS
jgi:hypothetical protein